MIKMILTSDCHRRGGCCIFLFISSLQRCNYFANLDSPKSADHRMKRDTRNMNGMQNVINGMERDSASNRMNRMQNDKNGMERDSASNRMNEMKNDENGMERDSASNRMNGMDVMPNDKRGMIHGEDIEANKSSRMDGMQEERRSEGHHGHSRRRRVSAIFHVMSKKYYHGQDQDGDVGAKNGHGHRGKPRHSDRSSGKDLKFEKKIEWVMT